MPKTLPQQTVEYHLANGRRIAEEFAGRESLLPRELRFLVHGRYSDALATFRALVQDPEFPDELRRRWANGSTITPPAAEIQTFVIEAEIPIASLLDPGFIGDLLRVVERHHVIFDGWGVPLG